MLECGKLVQDSEPEASREWPTECPRKYECKRECPTGCLQSPSGPQAPECQKSVTRVSLECRSPLHVILQRHMAIKLPFGKPCHLQNDSDCGFPCMETCCKTGVRHPLFKTPQKIQTPYGPFYVGSCIWTATLHPHVVISALDVAFSHVSHRQVAMCAEQPCCRLCIPCNWRQPRRPIEECLGLPG